MKAITHDRFGSADVLQVTETDRPQVGDAEVLVRVRAASIHPGDLVMMQGRPYVMRAMGFGLRRPRKQIPGFDVAGHVEAVGRRVTEFRPGDEVVGFCRGGLAEYVSADEQMLAPKPSGLTFEQAAAVPTSAITALQAVRDAGNVQPGHHVLINGASGGVGTFAVQVAKTLGAEVTGVCSTVNVELVRSIGADHVIDYTRDDFTRSTQRYHLVLDNVANRSLAECRAVLVPGGILIPNNGTSGGPWFGPLGRIVAAVVSSPFAPGHVRLFVAKESSAGLRSLTELIHAGQVTPVIDRTFPLDQAAQAMEYLAGGHARGKIVISI